MASNHNPEAVVSVTDKITENTEHKSNAVAAWFAVQWRAILSELVATALLALFGCMACIPIDGLSEQSPLYATLGFGLIILINVQIFGHLSGAHMNPVVTLGSVIWGSTSIATGVAYFIAQCLGAVIGYGILNEIAPGNISALGICVTLPHPRINEYQALGIEIGLTVMLMFLCCGLWDPVNKDKLDSAAVKFGLGVGGLAIVGGPLTGCSMNPARSLGPALWSGMWVSHWVYWVGPIVGSIMATTFYKIMWLKREKDN